MSLVNHILDVNNEHTCTHGEGLYEYWGRSSKFQMFRCKSCRVVLFMDQEEIENLEISAPSNVEGHFADIYEFKDEYE